MIALISVSAIFFDEIADTFIYSSNIKAEVTGKIKFSSGCGNENVAGGMKRYLDCRYPIWFDLGVKNYGKKVGEIKKLKIELLDKNGITLLSNTILFQLSEGALKPGEVKSKPISTRMEINDKRVLSEITRTHTDSILLDVFPLPDFRKVVLNLSYVDYDGSNENHEIEIDKKNINILPQ